VVRFAFALLDAVQLSPSHTISEYVRVTSCKWAVFLFLAPHRSGPVRADGTAVTAGASRGGATRQALDHGDRSGGAEAGCAWAADLRAGVEEPAAVGDHVGGAVGEGVSHKKPRRGDLPDLGQHRQIAHLSATPMLVSAAIRSASMSSNAVPG